MVLWCAYMDTLCYVYGLYTIYMGDGMYNEYNGKTYLDIMYDEKPCINTVHYEFTKNKFKKLNISESFEIGALRNKNYYILYDYDYSKGNFNYKRYTRYQVYNSNDRLILDINPKFDIIDESCPSILSDGYIIRKGVFDSKIISVMEGEKIIEVKDYKIRTVWNNDKE